MAVRRLRAQAADGTAYMVICHWPEVGTTTPQGRDSLRGLPRYRLLDGQRLHQIDRETFEIVQTGQRLKLI